ncbi:hypothetical protein [Dolichospermum circinale]|uniref:hypothetical protein n=1 Tax=Dolichospermum circinale TaxID=109265 RepID=UPI002330433F|nr:hypothetical protein [Dolichospermum circinale]MDB9468501.1 hypothetical protein [Dolichospermum circinale CS-539/09]MDB9470733.1 hypothetical protein [Dolichospermum circinale CS-539]
MTSHTDEIQQLIADIDHLLSHSSQGLSKFLSHQKPREKEILQRVHDFLVQLSQDQVSEDQIPAETNQPSDTKPFSSLLTQFNQQSHSSTVFESTLTPSEPNQISTEIKPELTVLLQPLQAELSRLLAERASLIQEIRQLEQKQLQNRSVGQQFVNQEQIISQFLEVLMSRLDAHLKLNASPIINPNQQNLEAITAAIQPILESAERVEQLANLARNLDQRLLSLDGTVNIVFEALERNINTYYHSLSQALAKMHSQGMQGEQLMANFLNNLTQYLQQQSLISEPLISIVNPDIAEYPGWEELKKIPDLSGVTSVEEITSVSLETELLQEQPKSAKELDLTSSDQVDDLYASFSNPQTSSPANLSFYHDPLLGEDSNLSITSEVVSNDLLTVSIPAEPQEDLLSIPTSESPDDQKYNDQTIISDTAQESKATIELEPNSTDTITVLTDLLIDNSNEEISSETSNLLDNPEINLADTSVVTLPTTTENENQNLGFDNYISTISTALERDLVSLLDNFDLPLNYDQKSATNLDVEVFDQKVNSSLTTVTNIEDKKEDFSPASITSQQSPITAIQPPTHGENNDVPPDDTLNSTWYLGIDVGTTGISAALLNHSKLVVYPIYWSAENPNSNTDFQQSFRLPAEVYLPTNVATNQEKSGESPLPQSSVPYHLYSAQLKPYLQIAVPYQQERQKWEPMLQLNEFSAGPLIWIIRSLSKLLLTLKSSQTSTTPALIANAVGMNIPTFSKVIKNIAGVICTCPANWSEQYRFNIREAILTSQLVSHPQQIFFVEEAIATVLPELDSVNGQFIQISENQGLQPLKTSDYPVIGNTLAINIGAISTEMALVDIPANLGELTHKDFMLHSFAYAGKGIEQDIICQLLLPPKSRQPRQAGQDDHESANINPWHWQPSIPGLDEMQFSSLSLEALTLPKVGEPDTQARLRLQQCLESSILGQALLDAALALKLILQHQETFTLEFADQSWILKRRDLESQVFVPFVRRLNRELNKLLVARDIPTGAINQVIIGGGVAGVGTINRWLRQKLPNAKIIQDLYLGENGTPNCSRVALGLAMLPLNPQVLDIPKQQYTDYFLFSELLKLLPERSLSFGEVLQLFESRGINTRICQQRLLAFLEGELPPGLIPTTTDNLWLTHNSQKNPDYKAIASVSSGISPLFEKQGNLSYRPNSQQVQLLVRYLDNIKSSTVQSLEEPYSYLLYSQV